MRDLSKSYLIESNKTVMDFLFLSRKTRKLIHTFYKLDFVKAFIRIIINFCIIIRKPPRKSGLTPKTIEVIEWLHNVRSSPK